MKREIITYTITQSDRNHLQKMEKKGISFLNLIPISEVSRCQMRLIKGNQSYLKVFEIL